jgi:hypothetical protein
VLSRNAYASGLNGISAEFSNDILVDYRGKSVKVQIGRRVGSGL